MARKAQKKTSDFEDRVNAIEDELMEDGVVMFQPGKGLPEKLRMPSLPEDITVEQSYELGQLLNRFTQYKLYMRTLIGWQEEKLMISKQKYEQLSYKAYVTYGDRVPDKTREKMILSDDGIRGYYDTLTLEQHRLKVLERTISSIEDAIFLVSREISRRGSDFDEGVREHNVGNMRAGARQKRNR